MLRTFLTLLAAVAAFGADDPWAKVRDLKSGTELRIYKKGAIQPLLVKMDELTGESLIVVLKNEQMAIAKDQIERIDYRPAQPGGRLKKETKTTVAGSDPKPPPPGPSQGSQAPASSTSTSFSVGSKPDFETIYRRTPAVPKK